jgi:hypothetical protein
MRKRIINNKLRVILTLLLAGGLFSVSAYSIMIQVPLADLVAGADVIVIGQVTDLECTWNLDNSLIVTVVALRIQEVMKGRVLSRIILIQIPGGTMGDIGLKVSDVPCFQKDETALVFLKTILNPNSPKNSYLAIQNYLSSYEVFEQAQGKYAIDKNGLARKEGYDLIKKDDDTDRSLALTELKMKIKSMLRKASLSRGKSRE